MAIVGRPTKYKKEYAQAIIDYFRQECIKETETTVEGKNWSKTVTDLVPVFFPTFELFADSLDVDDDTLVEWAHKVYPEAHAKRGELVHPEFSAAYRRAKKIQKGVLLKFSLLGRFDTRFAQFMAINNFGMISAKTESKDQGEITFRKYEELDDSELAAALQSRDDSPARTLG
jgi:hypothetical protein